MYAGEGLHTGHVWKGIRGTARELRRCIPSSFGEPLDDAYIIMTPKASTVAADLIRIYSALEAFRKRHSNAQHITDRVNAQPTALDLTACVNPQRFPHQIPIGLGCAPRVLFLTQGPVR